jgi:hypothetical protein
MAVLDPELDLSSLYDLGRSAGGAEKVFVLDGQQRLQSLHSLFRGGMAGPGGKVLEAYFDVSAGPDPTEGDLIHRVRWSNDRLPLPWFRIRDLPERFSNGNALEIADSLNDELLAMSPEADTDRGRARERRVRTNLSQLSGLLNHEKYFWVDELDGVAKVYPYRRILEIFVRVNSGGTKLTAGDLMFAAMKEGWEDIEARIEQTVDLLNGGKLSIESDFVLKGLLLAQGEGAELGPDRFDGDKGSALLKKMEAGWERAEQAFRELRDFMTHALHLHADRLVRSYNALLPLFVYLYDCPKPAEHARALMTAYFHKSQLFGWFGSQGDAILNALAGTLRRAPDGAFPLADITEYFRSNRNARVEIAPSMLSETRLRPLLLNIVYSQAWGSSPFDVKFKGNEPHIDHIYPQYMLRAHLGLDSSAINDLGNLRFVGATDNIRKRAELPDSYFGRLQKSRVPIERHLLVEPYASHPERLGFDVETFEHFRQERKKALLNLLSSVVDLKPPTTID